MNIIDRLLNLHDLRHIDIHLFVYGPVEQLSQSALHYLFQSLRQILVGHDCFDTPDHVVFQMFSLRVDTLHAVLRQLYFVLRGLECAFAFLQQLEDVLVLAHQLVLVLIVLFCVVAFYLVSF